MYRLMFRAVLALTAIALSPANALAQQDGLAESGDTQRRGAAAAMREQIRTDPLAPNITPRHHDITIVFFSDYQCGFCRRFSPTLDALVAQDPKLRVVYRDWPILGGGSEPGARAAIAASFQGRHIAFHRALLSQPGRVDADKIRAAATIAKLDWNRLTRDQVARKGEIDALLARNNRYARVLGLSGTPAVMVGDTLVPGLVDLATLRQIVAEQRKNPRAH